MGYVLDYLVNAWKSHLSPILSGLWDSVFFWRSVALVALTVFFGVWLLRHRIMAWMRRPQAVLHDKGIFERSDALMSEADLQELLQQLYNDHSYYSDSSIIVRRFRFLWGSRELLS